MSAESEIDFFISYNRHDRAFAEWIAWILEDAGHQVKIQAWDFRAGENFVLEMDRAATEAKVTIAVLSETYLKSGFARSEWAAAFAQDPTGEMRKLIPVRVKECDLSGLLSQTIYIDLVGLAEEEAQERLMREISQSRLKPDCKPAFPNCQASVPSRLKPVFPPSIPANLPRISDVFVGREVNLEELHKRLQTGRATAIWAIAGMGGIGKTELAAHYAFQHRDLGTYVGGICWLKGREELGTQIVAFARSHLQMTFPENVELSEQVRLCWAQWQPAESLIVFDDVQDYADIEPFLPPQLTHFKILLTTRSRFGSPVQDYEIQVLSEEASLNLLRSLAPDGRINQDLEGAKQICEWLGYLPLGLELVGRYLKQKSGTPIAELWKRLQEKKLAAKALLKAEPGMTASLGVTAAFELSWQELNKEAQQLAALLSLFALAEIPWPLVQQCLSNVDEEELEDLRDEQLVNSSLLSFEGGENYQLHQLLREFFAVKIGETEQKKLKTKLAIILMGVARTIPHLPTLKDIQAIKVAIPHLKQIAADLQNLKTQDNLYLPYQIGLGWVFIGISRFYYGQGMYAEAEYWDESCLAIDRSLLGEEHPDTARSLNNLAVTYTDQGRYAEAEPLLLQALKVRQSLFGEQDSDVAQSLNHLGVLYRIQGRYAEAEPLLLQALKVRQSLFGQQHWDVQDSLSSLAALYRAQGCYEKAEPLYHQALDLAQSGLGERHPSVTALVNNLALLYYDQGRYAEAEPLYRQALELNQSFLGEQHPAVAINLNNLAGLYRAQKRYQEAEQLYLQACLISHQKMETTHPATELYCKNFLLLLNEVIQSDRTSELSDHPMTRSLLQQLQNEES